LAAATTLFAGTTEREESQVKDAWVKEHLAGSQSALPFSFTYDGQPSAPLLAEWPVRVADERLDAARTRRTLTWSDPKTGLEVRCVAVDYADYPAIEWTVWFRNTGKADTPVLENIQGLDARFERCAGGEFVLHGITGDSNSRESYQPYELPLRPQTQHRFIPEGGRPTNERFPYYNLQSPGGGLLLAVGWPGQWAAAFTRDAANGLRIVAGQELTHLLLRPGEEIRTPLIALLFWKGGDVVQAQNLWRRWMIAHNVPRPGGRLPAPFNSICLGLRQSEASEIQGMDTYLKGGVKHDYWWMDAGWYPGVGWWAGRGTWEPDPARFPKGIKAVSDYAHAKGMKLVLWFEPETVDNGTWVATNHPDWVLGGRLLNLGNPAARQWLTDHVIRVIAEQGIDLYRQDFNQDPLDCWRKNDAPERQGLTENLHVQGYLAFWDALRRQYPDMLIDSCASGGRRNDLETLRRGVPLLRSDYQGPAHPAVSRDVISAGNQGHGYGMAMWIPYYGTGEYYNDTYSFRSHMCPAMGVGYDPAREPVDWEALRRTIACWREVAPNYYGDYYPLTKYSLDAGRWMAWQFNRPEQGAGMVQAFRRKDCGEAARLFRLRGLDPAAVYAVKNFDEDGSMTVSGQDLMEKGLTVEIKDKPGAAVIAYRQTKWFTRPGELSFAVANRSKRAAATAVAITCRGEADPTQAFSVSAADPWVKIVPGSGAGDGQIFSVSVEPGDRPSALYTSKIVVTPRDASENILIPVRLRLGTPVPRVVTITPAIPRCAPQEALRLSASVADQFGDPCPAKLRWSVSGGGTIDRHGRFHSDGTKGEYTVSASVKGTPSVAATAQLTVAPVDLARWKLDETSGTVAADAWGGLPGTLVGGPTWEAGRLGGALRLNGKGQYVDTGWSLAGLELPCTFAFWVNPAANQCDYADIFGNHEGSTAGLVMQQDGAALNRYSFGYGSTPAGGSAGSLQLTADEWQHVAVVCDGEDVLIYLNGKKVARGAGRNPITPNPKLNFRLGSGWGAGRFFNGALDDFRIYARALSADEIQALMKE
jgi:alpha-galactosidase